MDNKNNKIEVVISKKGTLRVRCPRHLEDDARELITGIVQQGEHVEFTYTD